MSGTQTQKGVEDTLKDFWATRPRRPRQGRKVAGVAAGIGARYAVDPVIIRVAFAVATVFGGSGVLLYLLGWLFFAEEGDEVSAAESLLHKGRSSTSQHLAIGLCIALIPAFSWFIDDDASSYVGMAVVLGLLFLLHRGRADLGQVPVPVQRSEVSAAEAWPPQPGEPGQPGHEGQHGQQGQAVDVFGQPTTPPAWDPLGAAPFAWDLPEPGSALEPEPDFRPEPARRARSAAGPVVLAAAVLTGVAAALAMPYTGWLTIPHVAGLVMAVLGAGMVLASLRGHGRGLVGLAIPMGVAAVAVTLFFPQGFRADGFGEIDVKPTSLQDVQPEYRRNAGGITVDLTALPNSGSTRTEVHLDAGNVAVVVPRDADVVVECGAGLGTVSCLGANSDGLNPEQVKHDNGPDGEGGLKVELTARVSGPGEVVVRRG
ncbi:PspC domain-containing protein [Actinokineospora bangkokensis]|uniref:PspC domain-containing protein n=1 Tax=Actinokineospora bangkokensis TaxID=1193682 RepID=UPI0013019A39|nr:PspC domain-containing protein [Actinokineospora bangkokensis]